MRGTIGCCWRKAISLAGSLPECCVRSRRCRRRRDRVVELQIGRPRQERGSVYAIRPRMLPYVVAGRSEWRKIGPPLHAPAAQNQTRPARFALSMAAEYEAWQPVRQKGNSG
jgi:hypothetical protein